MGHDDAIARAPASRGDQRYLRRWLDRHGPPDQPATALLAARVTARRRAEHIEAAFIGVAVLLLLGWSLWPGAGGRSADTGTVMPIVAAYTVLQLGALLALRYLRRADRRLAGTLRHRVARPTSWPLPAMLGGWYVAGAVAVFGGGLLTGAAALLLASHPTDRLVAAIFSAALVLLAGLGGAVLLEVHRRPAVAHDAESLADDDALRREDAHRAVSPYLALLALIAAFNSRSGDPLLAVYAGYVIVGGVGWMLAFAAARNASRRPDPALTTPTVPA